MIAWEGQALKGFPSIRGILSPLLEPGRLSRAVRGDERHRKAVAVIFVQDQTDPILF
jgi:hypothetical protein